MKTPKVTIIREVRCLGVSRGIDSIIKNVIREALLSECGNADFEVAVTYTNDENIRQLNAQFRKIDRATDVLSFPMLDFRDGEPLHDFSYDKDPITGLAYLGDIVLSVERAHLQATQYAHSFEREMAFLTAHSMLHLLGYDHEDDDLRRQTMERKQEEILEKLGITRE